MSSITASTYIYRMKRIDPQAEPFSSESDSIVQSNGLSKSSRVSVLGDCGEKNPLRINLFHTFTPQKYFPKFHPHPIKLVSKSKKYPSAYSPQKFFPVSHWEVSSDSSSFNFLPSRLRPSAQLHTCNDLPVSPISQANSAAVSPKKSCKSK